MNPAAITDIVSTSPINSNMGALSAILYPGVILEHSECNENGRTGSESTFVYTGTYLALKGQQAWCRSWGAYNMALVRQENSSRWKLTSVFPFDESGGEPALLTGTYELDVEMEQPSVFSNPRLRSMLPDNYIAAVARIIENFQAGQYSMTTTGGATDAGWAAAVTDLKAAVPVGSNYQARALQLFSTVVAMKTEAFMEYYNVFKRTITAALPIQVQASQIGKKKIWTTAEIIAFENPPSSGFFQLDSTSLWYKTPPLVCANARQKTQVSYNYIETKQANGILYEPYNSAVLLYASPTDLPPNT